MGAVDLWYRLPEPPPVVQRISLMTRSYSPGVRGMIITLPLQFSQRE